MAQRSTRHSRGREARDFLGIYGSAVFLTVLGFFIAYQFVEPAPPRRITIATGSPSGAYYAYGQIYRAMLARDGIELVVRETAGSIENVRLLESGAADVAFVQSGVDGAALGELRSLGSLYFEPLWVFSREPVTDFGDLAGKRLAVGGEGSGTRAVALRLLTDNGLAGDAAAERAAELLPLDGKDAAEALTEGEADAVFLVASPSAPVVRSLLEDPKISLMSFTRAEAYARRYPFLSRVDLPEGVIDFTSNLPPRDVSLLAPAANLVAHMNFHPALIDLLLGAATEVHGAGGLFERPGEFPSLLYTAFPVDPQARRYLNKGPSFLQNYLPFWAANLIDRLKVLLVPLLTLMFPLFRIVPPTYRWRVRKRIYRWYREVQAVEDGLDSETEPLSALCAELDRIEEEVKQVSVPLAYADSLYQLRSHIELVRGRLRKSATEAPT